MDYPCDKFCDFSFSRFGFSCGQTDRQTDTLSRQNHRGGSTLYSRDYRPCEYKMQARQLFGALWHILVRKKCRSTSVWGGLTPKPANSAYDHPPYKASTIREIILQMRDRYAPTAFCTSRTHSVYCVETRRIQTYM